MLQIIVEIALKNQLLPSSLEKQINIIVWKQDFKKGDLEALNKLMDKIETGEVVYPG